MKKELPTGIIEIKGATRLDIFKLKISLRLHSLRHWYVINVWNKIYSKFDVCYIPNFVLCVWLLRLAFFALSGKIGIITTGITESKGGYKFYTVHFSHFPVGKSVSRFTSAEKKVKK